MADTRRLKSKVGVTLHNYLLIYSQNTTITVETTSIDRITFPLTFIIFSWGDKKKKEKGKSRLSKHKVRYGFLRKAATFREEKLINIQLARRSAIS